MIIDGKQIAESIYLDLKNKISKLEYKPCLGVILVGKSPASLRYIKQKEKYATFVGIKFKLLVLEDNISEDELLLNIDIFNGDDEISGFMVQLPLPNHINPDNIINRIDYKKDVDGFTYENLGKIMIGDKSGFIPCTPAGVMNIFNYLGVDLKGKYVTVLGKSNIVGKPMVSLLMNAGATVMSCNSKTKNIRNFTLISDIIISATGTVGIVNVDDIKNEAVVIDVGFSIIKGKICGDIYYKGIDNSGKNINITPVPGGVGPLTVANLMKNTLKSYYLGKI